MIIEPSHHRLDSIIHGHRPTLYKEKSVSSQISAIDAKEWHCRRSVRFDETRNREYADVLRNPDHWDQTWYTCPEYAKFRRNLHKANRKVRELDRGNPNSFSAILEHAYNNAFCDERPLLELKQVQKLGKVYSKNPARVGLDVTAVASIVLDAEARRAMVLDLVEELQDDYGNCGLMATADSDAAEELRDALKDLSGPSCLLARFVALALRDSEITCGGGGGKRSVRFNERGNQEYADELRSGCAVDCCCWDEAWYTSPEYAMFQWDAQKASRKLREKRGCCRILEAVYEVACDERTLPPRLEMQLARLYAKHPSLMIGLEGTAVRSILLDADGRREQLCDLMEEVTDEFETCSLADGEAAEELSECLNSLTHASSLFARFLAQAQQSV